MHYKTKEKKECLDLVNKNGLALEKKKGFYVLIDNLGNELETQATYLFHVTTFINHSSLFKNFMLRNHLENKLKTRGIEEKRTKI